jgi:hypothetical protein
MSVIVVLSGTGNAVRDPSRSNYCLTFALPKRLSASAFPASAPVAVSPRRPLSVGFGRRGLAFAARPGLSSRSSSIASSIAFRSTLPFSSTSKSSRSSRRAARCGLVSFPEAAASMRASRIALLARLRRCLVGFAPSVLDDLGGIGVVVLLALLELGELRLRSICAFLLGARTAIGGLACARRLTRGGPFLLQDRLHCFGQLLLVDSTGSGERCALLAGERVEGLHVGVRQRLQRRELVRAEVLELVEIVLVFVVVRTHPEPVRSATIPAIGPPGRRARRPGDRRASECGQGASRSPPLVAGPASRRTRRSGRRRDRLRFAARPGVHLGHAAALLLVVLEVLARLLDRDDRVVA